jgi:hypothetical protein
MKIKEFFIDKKKGKTMTIKIPPSRNSPVLASFALYCQENPEERFWQAIRNWTECSYVLVDGEDTFYWENRKGGERK